MCIDELNWQTVPFSNSRDRESKIAKTSDFCELQQSPLALMIGVL